MLKLDPDDPNEDDEYEDKNKSKNENVNATNTTTNVNDEGETNNGSDNVDHSKTFAVPSQPVYIPPPASVRKVI